MKANSLIVTLAFLTAALLLGGLQASAGEGSPVAIARKGPKFNLSWKTVKGRSYRLFVTTDLASPWREVGSQPKPLVAGEESMEIELDLDTGANSFYMVTELALVEQLGMVWIPPGEFVMGSPADEIGRSDDEGPQTAVTVSRGFWIGRREVTQGEYETLMGHNPSWFNGPRFAGDYGTDLTRPVELISWSDAGAYCEALTAQEQSSGRLPAGYVFRLPTEAEWEYACRAGTATAYSYGDDPQGAVLGDYAWWQDNSVRSTHSTGVKLPNPWGLHDMHGNVAEWCRDYFAPGLAGGIMIDPQGPAEGSERVVRGGFWLSPSVDCRSARRTGRDPDLAYSGVGLRVVLAEDP